jgi:hypothetical protein
MSKGLTQKKITLLWGLPGSGKTTYAESLQRNVMVSVVDLDGLQKGMKFLEDKVISALSSSDHVILDGLITTNFSALRIMDAIHQKMSSRYKLLWEIVYWHPDIDACLWNDRERRSQNSEITIRHTKVEEPSRELLDAFDITEKRFIKKKVVRKPVWFMWGDDNIGTIEKDGILKSMEWSLGGTVRGYDGYESRVYPESQPIAFKEFDQLMEKLCPNISFMQYKLIYNECVSVNSDLGRSDYYGGSTSHARFECDLAKLYLMLEEKGLLPST